VPRRPDGNINLGPCCETPDANRLTLQETRLIAAVYAGEVVHPGSLPVTSR